MFSVVDTGLATPKGPVSGAVRTGGMLITAQIPKDASGEIVNGNIAIQTHQILQNLSQTLESAGGSLRDVAHMFIHLIDADDAAEMNRIYYEYFSKPYPCRCTVVVKELLSKHMRIELVAFAHVGA
jgi:enamine deaminase RidA (YjgF/YER057c/UK114 family)